MHLGHLSKARQLFPKFKILSSKNQFRKYEFLFSSYVGPSYSGMKATQPSSFIGDICVGDEGKTRSRTELNLDTSAFPPSSLPAAHWWAIREGRSAELLWFVILIYSCHLVKVAPGGRGACLQPALSVFVFQKVPRAVSYSWSQVNQSGENKTQSQAKQNKTKTHGFI